MLLSFLRKYGVVVLVTAIKCYQFMISPFLPASCRFSPSCSEFARKVILRYGLIRGTKLAGYRVLSCRAFCNKQTKIKERTINE